jgi:hypothetical protein
MKRFKFWRKYDDEGLMYDGVACWTCKYSSTACPCGSCSIGDNVKTCKITKKVHGLFWWCKRWKRG